MANMNMNLTLSFNKPRSRSGFCLPLSDPVDKVETLEELFERFEVRLREKPRSVSESAAQVVPFESDELKHWIVEKSLGSGASGHVDLMRDRNGNRYAVKKMMLTNRTEANRQIRRDLEFLVKAVESAPNDNIVRFHGYARKTFEAWIVMEVMDSCFGKLLQRLEQERIPEEVIGAMCASVVKALHHLKIKHKMIHRDVRPTNILVDRRGNIKLCDFGISRVMINSIAHTADAGNKYYLAPERVFGGKHRYGIKSDIWSLGITLIEVAVGRNPYVDCDSEYVAGLRIMNEPSPALSEPFSSDFRDFVSKCLQKEETKRPNYEELTKLSFFRKYENCDPDVVGNWVQSVLKDEL